MLATLIHDQATWVKWLVFLLAIGLLVTLSPITPFTTEDGIPITLQSLLVVFLPIVVGWRIGVAAVVVYLIIGGLGAPVFSYGTYGWNRFTGSSGGFLLAFPIAGLLAGYAMEPVSYTHLTLPTICSV